MKIGVSDLYKDPLERQEFTFKIAKAGSITNEILELQKKDGTGFIGSISAVAVKNKKGDIKYFDGMIEDITERKRAEEALRESEARLRSIFNTSSDAILVFNAEGALVMTNPAAARMYGYHEEEMIGLTGRDIVHPECRHLFRVFIRECSGTGRFRTESVDMRKDDSFFNVEVHGSLFEYRGVQHLLAMVRDITARNEMEALGLLAGGVAHDLNNILSGIVSYPELILMDLPDNSPLRKPMKTIHKSGMRAAGVVTDLLTIARGVATGKEALNLNTIVNEYMGSAEFQNLATTNAFVHFRSEPAPHLLNMRGSSIHLEKTLMNLVINASEAIEGGGAVTISTCNRYLDEPVKGYDDVRMGEYVVLSVSDNGRGISGKDMERIFEPFYSFTARRSWAAAGQVLVWQLSGIRCRTTTDTLTSRPAKRGPYSNSIFR